MLEVTFIDANGHRRTVAARAGGTLMEAAIENDVDGIVALTVACVRAVRATAT